MFKNKIKLAGIIAGIIVIVALLGFMFFKAAKIGFEYVTVNNTIEEYLKDGKYEESIKYIDSHLKTNPKQFKLLSYKGYILIEMGESEKAISVLEAALKIRPKSDLVLNNLSWACYNLGRNEEALDYSSRALEISPEDEITLVNKGNALLELERYDEALAAYGNAISLNTEYGLAYYGRGIAYYDIGKYYEAAKDFSKYTSLVPDDVDGYIYLGQAYLNEGSYNLAIETFIDILEMDPDNTYAYLLKGQALDGIGRYSEAIKSYDMAIKLDPQYTDAYMNKGISYFEQAKYKEAVDYLDKAIAIEPDYTDPYIWKAKAFIAVEEYNKAIDMCNMAISINSYDAFAYNILSRAYYMLEDYEAALDAATMAIEVGPEFYEDAYVAKASILYEQGNYIDGLVFIDNALKLFPDSKDLLWYKADMLSNSLKHDEAIKLYERVLEIDGEDNDVLLDAAWEYYYAQDYNKSMDCLNRVEKLDIYNSEIELLEGFLKEASLPEGQRIADFVRENYLYIGNVKDFEKKARDLESDKELEIADINGFLKSVIDDKDKFSYFVYGREYEELNKEELEIHIIDKLIKADINYIRIPVFTEASGYEFVRAVNRINNPEGKTLIIDLRNNPGGSIKAANEMLDSLIGKSITSSLVYKGGRTENYESDKNQITFKKIVVMVNENSASSSEILALSLKKHLGNVTIIGHPTFGKGVGQLAFENKPEKYAIFITSFSWNVKNQNITGSRITPDIIVKGEKDSDYFDAVYKFIDN